MSKWVSFEIRFQIWVMPCAVCGIPFHIHCDHVIPVSKGGSNHRSNLQPLCRWCNLKKNNRLTNEKLTAWVKKRGEKHFLEATYKWDTRYFGFAEGPTFEQWFKYRPERVRYAQALYESFLLRCK